MEGTYFTEIRPESFRTRAQATVFPMGEQRASRKYTPPPDIEACYIEFMNTVCSKPLSVSHHWVPLKRCSLMI